MSVLIKGMEMPKDEGVLLWVSPDGTVTQGWHERFGINWSGSEYKAIEIPPHGRLIDADALMADLKFVDATGEYYTEAQIEYAPTIIEAEE